MDKDLMDQSPPDAEDFLDLRLDGSTDDDDEFELRLGTTGSADLEEARQETSQTAELRTAGRPWLWGLVVIAFPFGGLVGYALKAGPPQLGVSRELVDFGEQRVATQSELVFELQSRGESPLEIAATTLEENQAGDFSVLEQTCVGQRIPNGQSCTVKVGFTPSAPGARRSRLLVTSNATVEPVSTAVIGVGTAPALRVEPAQLDFVDRKLGMASAPARFWLASSGTASARIESVKVSGAAAAEFVVMSDACSGSLLEPGRRCALEILFIPKRVGERRATIVVSSDAEVDTEGKLRGRGLDLVAGLRTDLDRMSFGEAEVGEQGATESVVLSSSGDGPLEVKRVTVSGDSGFRVLAKNCGQLTPGESCRVDVRFQPVDEGEARARLEIYHNGAEGVTRVLLTGSGTRPRLGLDPQRLSFGEVLIGTKAPARLLEVLNVGSGLLSIEGSRMGGADASVFRVTRETCGSAGLSRSGSAANRCAFEVEFRPRRRGPHRAELIVTANGQDSSVALNGLGVESRLEVSPGRLELGEVELGRSSRAEVSLSNVGRAALTIRSVSMHGSASSDFDIVADRCSGATLESSRQCSFEVRFEPTRIGLKSVQISIRHDGPDGERSLSARGTGREQRRPKARIRPERLEVPGQRVGQLSPIETVTVSNDGTAPLAIRSIRIVGPNAADFYTVSGSCEGLDSLAPGRECTLGIRFEPAEIGTRRASLLIRHDAAGGSVAVSLVGESF